VLLAAILTGFPDRLARRRQAGEYQFASGGSGQLADTSAVAGEEFILAIDVEVRADRRVPLIRVASAIRPDWLVDFYPERIEDRSGVEWNRTAERVEAVSALLYDGLTIDETRGGSPDAWAAAQLLMSKALDERLSRFVDEDELRAFLARVAFASERCGIPRIGEEDVREVLRALCAGRRSFTELEQADVLGGLLARPGLTKLDEVAPQRLRLPSGRQVRVNYEPGNPPWIASRLQDFFGMKEGPTIGGQPVVVRLLAPNQRPVQVTSDLAGFWERLYPQVRRELSRRYPKHRWPERPV
jgi:ATP-dependent helicase HrpB